VVRVAPESPPVPRGLGLSGWACGLVGLRSGVGLRGIGPVLAEEALGRIGLSRCALGILVIASKARFGPIPLRLAYGALRGIGPALAEEAQGRFGLSRVARGILVIASKARCGPIPLRLAYGALRGTGPALAEEAQGRFGLSRVARGILVFASKARCGPIPLRLAYGALRGTGPALAEEALGRMGLSRCARGIFGVRFQGSLRTDPAPLGVLGRSAGPVLRSLRRLWEGLGFRAVREGFGCLPSMLAPARSRCRPGWTVWMNRCVTGGVL